MNLLFLVEGKTELIVYKSWVESIFPDFQLVARPEDMTKNTFRIVAGNGFPHMISRSKNGAPSLLEACILDAKNYSNIDHFFVCVDSENNSYQKRFEEVNLKIEEFILSHEIDQEKTPIHLIIQHCCIETWALGNAELLNQRSMRASQEFLDFQAYYDVFVNDPEKLECCPPGYRKPRQRQKFHRHYLEVYFQALGMFYSKKNPKPIATSQYLESLQTRCRSTNHLRSLKNLLEILTQISEQANNAISIIAPKS